MEVIRRVRAARWALLLLALALAAPALCRAADLEVPFLAGRVNDTAGMLSPEARQRIEEKLRAFEAKTGDQVVVLTVPSLGDEPIEDYSVRVAQTWKLGQKGKDNGVLLLISKADRKMRIEVGYGLEPELTDLEAQKILDDVLRPRFRDGDFDGGVEAGVDAIASTLQGQEVEVAEKPPGDTVGELPLVPRIGFAGLFLAVVGIFSLAAVTSGGCQSWFLYLFLTPFYFAVPSSLFGPPVGIGFALAWLIGFPLLRLLLGNRPGRRGPRARTWPVFLPGGWGGGGWSSRGGWRGGGGGGFGGFSGGGGSFGGGGASGSW